jgi:membrane fusion protein (multidrug efflux system)
MISMFAHHRCFPAFRVLRPAALAAVLAALTACSGGGAPDAGNARTSIPVEVAAVVQQPVTANYSGTATLEAVADAQVVTKTTGIILKILTEEGERVEKGQLLALLDDDAARNKLEQASATLSKAQAAFDKSEKGYALKITPRTQYDSDRYDLETQKAVVAGARLDLSYTRIVAPIAGVIAKRSVKTGNLVQTNAPLFQIVDMDPIQAVLNVPERNLDMLKSGQSVRMQVDALAGKSFDGVIARIAPVVDAASGTFRVTCEFRDATHTLMPGMFGRIDIAYDQRRDALVAPRAALVEEDGETAVFTIEPVPEKPAAADAAKGKSGEAVASEVAKPAPQTFIAKRRLVKTGYADGDRIEIRAGLQEGERVITIGRNAVRDGTQVQLIDAPAASNSATGEKPQ